MSEVERPTMPSMMTEWLKIESVLGEGGNLRDLGLITSR